MGGRRMEGTSPAGEGQRQHADCKLQTHVETDFAVGFAPGLRRKPMHSEPGAEAAHRNRPIRPRGHRRFQKPGFIPTVIYVLYCIILHRRRRIILWRLPCTIRPHVLHIVPLTLPSQTCNVLACGYVWVCTGGFWQQTKGCWNFRTRARPGPANHAYT